MECVLVYIRLGWSGRNGLVYITRRGQAFVAYPQVGAMREPDIRDRRGEKLYSHVFFLFPPIRDDSNLEC